MWIYGFSLTEVQLGVFEGGLTGICAAADASDPPQGIYGRIDVFNGLRSIGGRIIANNRQHAEIMLRNYKDGLV
jgi:hypothetical protein